MKEVTIRVDQEGEDSVIEFSLPGASVTLRYTDPEEIDALVSSLDVLMERVEGMIEEEIAVEQFMQQVEDHL
jgi:hypothetical protein